MQQQQGRDTCRPPRTGYPVLKYCLWILSCPTMHAGNYFLSKIYKHHARVNFLRSCSGNNLD